MIHKNMSIADQADQVRSVKRSEAGMIIDPVTLYPEATVAQALDLMRRFGIGGIPITDRGGKLVGILTNRALRFETDMSRLVRDVMTSKNLVTVPEGTTLETARKILQERKIEKLPVVDSAYHLIDCLAVLPPLRRWWADAQPGARRLLDPGMQPSSNCRVS